MPKLLSNKEVQEKIDNNYGKNNYLLISDFKGVSKPIKVKHLKCGNIYEIKKANNFLNENRSHCPFCKEKISHSTRRKTEEEIINLIKETDSEYEYISGYINSNTKMKLLHKTCNTIFEVTPHMFFGVHKTRCPKCSNKNRGKHLRVNNFEENKDFMDDDYIWLEDYKGNNKIKHKIKHLECGHVYEVRPNDFQQGYRCPKCSKEFSKNEKEILNFIKTFYKGKIEENNSEIINPFELDILIENIAIEYDGLFWHSTYFDRFRENKNYHLNKTELCKNKNIRLIHIFEDEWLYKKDIVKSKIKSILNSNNNLPKIYARKCIIKEVNSKDKNEFLEKNHLQGKDKSILNLGLYFDNKLISVMTFSELRINLGNKNKKEGYYELSRFASDINYHVVGAFSKLFKYFERNYEFRQIITYADRRWSEGNVYIKNGFELDHISKPSYFYITKGFDKKYNRFNFAKYKLKDKFPDIYSDDKTEEEICNEAGFYRIYDCGNLVFIYNFKENIR